MLKRSKTIKIMKGSKNRGRLTQVKVLLYVTCFCIYRKQEISIYYDSKEIHAIEYCFWLWCTFWASYWHIKCKVSWERTFKRLHNSDLSKRLSFWDPVKKFRRCHQKCSIKKAILKKLHNIHRKSSVFESLLTCVGVPAKLLKRDSNVGVFLWILRMF